MNEALAGLTIVPFAIAFLCDAWFIGWVSFSSADDRAKRIVWGGFGRKEVALCSIFYALPLVGRTMIWILYVTLSDSVWIAVPYVVSSLVLALLLFSIYDQYLKIRYTLAGRASSFGWFLSRSTTTEILILLCISFLCEMSIAVAFAVQFPVLGCTEGQWPGCAALYVAFALQLVSLPNAVLTCFWYGGYVEGIRSEFVAASLASGFG